jgi:hypothetical protein
MSTKAEAILNELKTLPPEEQQALFDALREREARHRTWGSQAAALRDMQSLHSGRGLLNRLLEERARERARG